MPSKFIPEHWGRTVNKIVLLRRDNSPYGRPDSALSLGWTPSTAPRAADDVAGPRAAGSAALNWSTRYGGSVEYPLSPDELDSLIDQLKTARREAFPAHVAARKVKRRLERKAHKLGEKAGKRWKESVETAFRVAFPGLGTETEASEIVRIRHASAHAEQDYTAEEMRSYTSSSLRPELVMVAADEENPKPYWHPLDNVFKPYPPVTPHEKSDCDSTPYRDLVCPDCGWRGLGVTAWERTIDNSSSKTSWRITKYPT